MDNNVQQMQAKGPSPNQIAAHLTQLEGTKEVNLLNSKSLELKIETTKAKIAEFQNEVDILRHNLRELTDQRKNINMQIDEWKKKVKKIQV